MPKKGNDDLVGNVPDIPIFKGKNEPEIEIPPEALQSILEYFNVAKEFELIALECETDKLQVIIRTASNHVSAHYLGMPEDTIVKQTGYFIFETAKMLSIIGKKYKDANMLNVTWPEDEKIQILADNASPVNISPKSIQNISMHIPPLNRRFLFKDQVLQFNAKDDKGVTLMEKDGVTPQTEDAKTKFITESSELLKGDADIAVAGGVDYIIYNFSKDASSCISGTWSPKGDDSRTDNIKIDEFEGETIEMAMPKMFLDVAKKLSQDISVNAYKAKKMLSLSQYSDNGSEEIHYCIRESKKRD